MSESPHHTRLPPALYVVATPIGNLGDITLRALDTLKSVDRVAAEDTRVSGQLLAHFDIRKPLVSIREHNEREAANKVIAWIAAGEAVAYVSDAGTPAVSDPGARLVAAVRAAGQTVVPVPGASAVTTALSAAGIESGQWLFHGFLPPKSGARRAQLQTLAALPVALVFYEAPHRIEETLIDMAAVLDGARLVTLARELTKRFESIVTLPLADAPAWLAADPNHVRGEFVVIVHPPAAAAAMVDAEAMRVLDVLLGELPPTLAAKLGAKISGRSKAELYKMSLALKPQD
ncbi:MAG TPA: 16S rRNA (cytidine(1402)-2'-O)-methyltransferase [Thiobacillus sp.]|jgi:16S rRNA (cytidine1402-2'-O)-methyltransferase|nr:16S rRNA (cytidine(1402)-2'-O)-methyltransferase [Gammaproteobacteria bacterium]OYZ29893.1 MAG: 16S rRNA (cytidine(1402)-2'-O)-methyltransferase [Hydrogenophilales bacterium 16-64-40]OZA35336.1 MAG: 16S rRNA (cytidine(1402)-2'-O)-methyltransferase [Hydrogenophilales bacterium 17-64-65]HQS82903.1 16S rRNA (cytidine(1402)-2'-O)-methyltransferase [Thiobacillus sp.]HQT33685.1 16S rRNA (cytidine(1402)-2'-O)-methyltransferase [Thiobacillus sp.]